MAIGQIELNQAMTRIQDYTTQKHNDDQRGVVQQEQAQFKFNKDLNQDIRKVVKTDQSEYQNKTQYQNRKFDAKEKGDNQYLAQTQWTWVWVDSRIWCLTGRPGVLRFMGSQRVGHD